MTEIRPSDQFLADVRRFLGQPDGDLNGAVVELLAVCFGELRAAHYQYGELSQYVQIRELVTLYQQGLLRPKDAMLHIAVHGCFHLRGDDDPWTTRDVCAVFIAARRAGIEYRENDGTVMRGIMALIQARCADLMEDDGFLIEESEPSFGSEFRLELFRLARNFNDWTPGESDIRAIIQAYFGKGFKCYDPGDERQRAVLIVAVRVHHRLLMCIDRGLHE